MTRERITNRCTCLGVPELYEAVRGASRNLPAVRGVSNALKLRIGVFRPDASGCIPVKSLTCDNERLVGEMPDQGSSEEAT